jgi:hypothetical protein
MFGLTFPLLLHTARAVAVLEDPPRVNVYYTRLSFSAFASSCSFVIGAGSGEKIFRQAEKLPTRPVDDRAEVLP